MKKVVILLLVFVLILQSGIVLAKGGKGQRESLGPSGPSEQKDQSGEENHGQNGKNRIAIRSILALHCKTENV